MQSFWQHNLLLLLPEASAAGGGQLLPPSGDSPTSLSPAGGHPIVHFNHNTHFSSVSASVLTNLPSLLLTLVFVSGLARRHIPLSSLDFNIDHRS